VFGITRIRLSGTRFLVIERGTTMDRKKLSDYRWKDIADGFNCKLSDGHGGSVAEVHFCEDHGQKWSWFVYLPPDWTFQGSAAGLAANRANATAICEAILTKTILNP
jgi:hypothetical protein